MAAPRARHWLCSALATARQLRRASLRDVAEGTDIPARRLIALEDGSAVPTPSEFWSIWSYLAQDDAAPSLPASPRTRPPMVGRAMK